MKNILQFSFWILTAVLLSFSSCSKDENTGQVTLLFDHEVQDKALVFNQFNYASEAGHTFSVSRMKYYVSNLSIVDQDGTIIDLPGIHYRDAEFDDTRSITYQDVPEGKYVQLNFTFGLNENANVDGGLPNTLTNINMEWPIPGDQGYHYMKFEGKYDSFNSGVIKNFNLHTGATKGNQNYINISLALNDLVLVDEQWDIKVMLDLNEWMQNPITYDFEVFGPMIMANQDAQNILKANGPSVFSIESIEKK